MFKTILAITLAAFLSACASVPKFTSPSFRLGEVKVALKEVKPNPAFPDQIALTTLIKLKLQEQLVAQHLYSADATAVVNYDMLYTRQFVGGALGMNNSFAQALLSYTRTIYVNGQLVDTHTLGQSHIEKRTFMGGLKKTAQLFGLRSTPQAELEEINTHMRLTIEDLPRTK